MAVRKSDVERQIAALQSQLDSAESDDEVWIKDETGHEVKVTGNRASAVLARFSKLWETDESDDDDGDDTEKQDPPAAAKKETYFKARGK